MQLSNLTEKQIAERASNKVEALLFYAYKTAEELELKRDGVLMCKLDQEQIEDSLRAQKAEIDSLRFLDKLVQEELDFITASVKIPSTII